MIYIDGKDIFNGEVFAGGFELINPYDNCLLYTSDAADE